MMESTAFFNAKATTKDIGLFLDIDSKRDIIKEFHFDGPRASLYKAEMEELKALVLGKTLEEALQLTNKAVAEALDGLPPVKMHCSNLAADALKAAIRDYKHRRGEDTSELDAAICAGDCHGCGHEH